MVADFADADAGLFHNLAADGFFDGFTLVDEAGEGGVHLHAREPAAGLAEDATVAAGDDDDDDRVGAGEVLGAAVGALADLAAALLVGGGAADAAEAMAVMPVDLGAGLGDDAGVGGRQDGAGSADFFELESVQVELGDGVIEFADIDGEVGGGVAKTEEAGFDGDARARDPVRRQPGGGDRVVSGEKNVEIPEGQEAAGGIADPGAEPGVVATNAFAAIEGVGAEYVRVSHGA